MIGTSS